MVGDVAMQHPIAGIICTANLRAQMVMSGALALLIFGGLLTVVAIDHPFSGSVKVGPKALIGVIEDFGDKTPR